MTALWKPRPRVQRAGSLAGTEHHMPTVKAINIDERLCVWKFVDGVVIVCVDGWWAVGPLGWLGVHLWLGAFWTDPHSFKLPSLHDKNAQYTN